MPSQPIYKVIFHNGGQVYEVFARQIYQSDMWGFVEVEELVFGERSQIVVDPGEEKLKNEFAGVKRSYIPLQAIIRIDEVEIEGAARVSDASSAKIPLSRCRRSRSCPLRETSKPPLFASRLRPGGAVLA